MKAFFAYLIPLLVLYVTVQCSSDKKHNSTEWREYLGGPDRNHYTTLDQINIDNVTELKVAWEYHTQDSGQLQCNPIIVDGTLYAITPTLQPFALDAETGAERWHVEDTAKTKQYGTSRGVTYWEDGEDKRILYTRDAWLYCVDARTGKAIVSFGNRGRISLKTGLGETAKDKYVISNTPGTIYEDFIIMPLRVSEDADAAPGSIQAFNVRTGKLEWAFKTIPMPGEYGYNTWPKEAYKNVAVGAANNWSGMSVDRSRGIVYVPTGSASFDFYGAHRIGTNLFANCLLALDAKTGVRKWHYQFVHHDVLDRDPPAPPNLITITRNGKRIDAVAQVTKQGYVFVFNRDTGEPLFPIEEVPVPGSDIPGEVIWPTQPRPVAPKPFARQVLTSDDISTFAPDREALLATLKNSRSEGAFTPLSEKGTVIFPGLDGGAEWGGAAVDPDGVLYVNSNEMPWLISLNKKPAVREALHPGEQLYALNCSSCHGADRKGNSASGFPSLIDLNSRFQREHVLSVITSGRAMMPAFKKLSSEEKKLLIAFLFGDKSDENVNERVNVTKDTTATTLTYRISGYTKFLDSNGHPAITPPWGTLNAIDLNTGEYVWKTVFGTTPELERDGASQTGSESYGGPVITSGGLLLIAGTKDKMFKAYNKKTGALLWQTQLPAAAFATPATYAVHGKQYIVMTCGGTKLGADKGNTYIAFALP